MDVLRELFPQHTVALLQRVLSRHAGNADAAAEFLFMGGVVPDESPVNINSDNNAQSAPSIKHKPAVFIYLFYFILFYLILFICVG